MHLTAISYGRNVYSSRYGWHHSNVGRTSRKTDSHRMECALPSQQLRNKCSRNEEWHRFVLCAAQKENETSSAMGSSEAAEGSALPELPPLDESYESVCEFTSYANWIIPGSIMLGRYPYVEPSRCLTRNQGDEQMQLIMSAGLSTFVSLQAEIPPQEEMRLSGVEGFLPYRGTAQSLAASLSEPPSLEELGALRTPELDQFLPPRRRPAPYAGRKRVVTNFLHFPIEDLSLPSAERDLKKLLEELEKRIIDGEKLYIHCWGGRGRAGVVGAILLAQMYGLDADEALRRIQRAFNTREDGQRRSPETNEQHEYVKKWIEERIYTKES